MDKKVAIPKIAGDSKELFDNAIKVGPGCEDFDVARKIVTLATLLGNEAIAPEEAASSSDAAIFEMHTSHEVGDGKMEADEGAEAVVDRKASAFVSASRTFIAEAVESGCEAAGTLIGSWIGSPSLGYAIGSTVGHFLNKPVGGMVSHGARKIVSYARQAWQWATNAAVGVVEKAVNWLFS